MQLAMTKAKASLRRYNQLFLLVAVLIIATVISRGVFMRPANLMVGYRQRCRLWPRVFRPGPGGHRRGIRSGGRLARRHVDFGDRFFSLRLWHCWRHDWGSRRGDGRRAHQRHLCVANENSSVHRHARHAVGRGLHVVDPRCGSADHRAGVQRRHLALVRLLAARRKRISDHRPHCRICRHQPAPPSEQMGTLHLRDRRQRSGRSDRRRAGHEDKAALLRLVRPSYARSARSSISTRTSARRPARAPTIFS